MTVRVNYQTTAVIDVDPEKGFTELCPDELPVTGALEIVPELLKNHAKGHLKLVSRDLHPPKAAWDAETPANMLEPVGLPNVDIKWNRHCVLGTTGVELLDGTTSCSGVRFPSEQRHGPRRTSLRYLFPRRG